MATSSTRTFVVEGFKLSVKILQDICVDLPPPASSVVNIVARVIAAIETLKSNRERCDVLRDRLLQLLLVITMTMKESASGRKGGAAIPKDLKEKIERFQANLETILEQVQKIKDTMKSKRVRRKVAAVFFGDSHSSILQKCSEDLDWAMKEFDVLSRLSDAIRLCEVFEKTRAILTNQVLQALPRAKYARFDSERPDKPSSCFEGARTAILDDITKWMARQDQDVQRVFWLSGIAGVGKATVARTIAQQARDAGILAGQFFFSRRGEAELRNPAIVFPTLAYQLARFDSEFGEAIIAALEGDPDAAFGSLVDQLDKLIIEPLSHIQRDPKRVAIIILDAFDECEARGAKEILQLLIHAIPRLPSFFKILVTSRPEPHVHSVLCPSNGLHITALHDIEASIVTSDIQLYLRHRLRNLPQELGLDLPSDWVKDQEIETLAEKAGNLFIHAATSLRFLLDSIDLRAQLDRLLKLVTSRRNSRGDSPFADLDELYLEILHGLITPRNSVEVAKMFQLVVESIVLLQDPLSVDDLSSLIGINVSNITNILARLSSVILPPATPDQSPRIYHPSFADFLQDSNRCTDARFRIDPIDHDQRMAHHCLTLMNARLRRGMLAEPDPALLNKEIDDLEKKVQARFPPDLQYACRYWASHLRNTTTGSSGTSLMDTLDAFVAKSLLPWIEAMSWLGDVRTCLTSLESIIVWAANGGCSSLTTRLLNDGYRLLLAYFSTISLGAQHIGRSIVPFLPRNILLASQYDDYADPAVKVLYGAPAEWSHCLMTLKSHRKQVSSVSFAPDGLQLASASWDRSICIWDGISGGLLARRERTDNRTSTPVDSAGVCQTPRDSTTN